jgi:hypothetical protein
MCKETYKELLQQLISMESTNKSLKFYCYGIDGQSRPDTFELLSNEHNIGIFTSLDEKYVPLLFEIFHASYINEYNGLLCTLDNVDDFMEELVIIDRTGNKVTYRTFLDNEYFSVFDTQPKQKFNHICADVSGYFYSMHGLIDHYF